MDFKPEKFKYSYMNKALLDEVYLAVPDDTDLVLSDNCFLELRDFIYRKSGIYFTESRKYLVEHRVGKRVTANNMKTYEGYLKFVRTDVTEKELYNLFEAITINETYFFRSEHQFDALEKIILPETILDKQKKGENVIRIWSAGSSTGEEAYTIGIILLEKFIGRYGDMKFEIVGSDINNSVLDVARTGIYRDYSIKNMSQEILEKYFSHKESCYYLNDSVKNLVEFNNINLYDPDSDFMSKKFDVVFCCNVMIYFDVSSKQVVISNLYDSLNNGGYMFIGYSETLYGINKLFKLIHMPMTMVYKKD